MNENISEDYVSFEAAKLLKKKGFNTITPEAISASVLYDEYYQFSYYMDTGEDEGVKFQHTTTNSNWFFALRESYHPVITDVVENTPYKWYLAPQQWQVVKWLRVEHGIHIMCEVFGITDDITYSFHTTRLWRPSSDGLNIHYREHNFKSPEEATEAAIKYCLEHLIK